ncbi:MAG: Flp pilus assembly protein CpaB [Tepidisphaeraceae bacterium]|jgi:pilus assembly protein CpaB
MNLKKVTPLILALCLGLLTLWMATRLLMRQQAESAAQPQRPQVVVARQNIDAGSVLTDENLTRSEVAVDSLPASVFKDASEIRGRVATVPIIQGQVITETLLAAKGVGAGLQAVVPQGMRAVTLDINEITGVAGNIVPGCHVDILQTMRDDRTGDQMARTIAQNVKVTAVGMRHNPGENVDSGGRSVTVLVTPQQAELLELASATGRPRFSLRGGNDLALTSTAGVTLIDLRGHESGQKDEFNTVRPLVDVDSSTTQPSTQPSVPLQWTIRVVRGGTETEVRFDVRKPVAELGTSNTGLLP